MSERVFWVVGLVLASPALVLAQEGAGDPFAAEGEDPFVEAEGEVVGPGTAAEEDDALPPATVPDGYGAQPAQPSQGVQPAQPAPGQGYPQPAAQPGYGQPGYYPAAQRPPRLQRIPYRDGMAIPEGGTLIERRRIGLIIAGAAMFGVSYGLSVSLYADTSIYSGWILVPVLGPLIETRQDVLALTKFFLVFDAVVQTAGLTLFILGLTKKRRYIEVYAGNAPGWAVMPRAGAQGGGLDLRATF